MVLNEMSVRLGRSALSKPEKENGHVAIHRARQSQKCYQFRMIR